MFVYQEAGNSTVTDIAMQVFPKQWEIGEGTDTSAPEVKDTPIQEVRNIKVTVRGHHFTIPVQCLRKAPASKLARLQAENEKSSVDTTKTVYHYYFDRNPDIFRYVYNFYMDGHLHMPPTVCIKPLEQELDFWGLSTHMLDRCCWNMFHKAREEEETLYTVCREWTGKRCEDFFAYDSEGIMCIDKDSRPNTFRIKLWKLLEEPNSSTTAQVWAYFTMFLIFFSLIVLSLETCVQFRSGDTAFLENITNISTHRTLTIMRHTKPNLILSWLELLSLIFLTFETFLRFVACPASFVKCPYQTLGSLSLIPSWLVMLLSLIYGDTVFDETTVVSTMFMIFNAMRALRVCLFFHVAVKYRALYILLLSLKASKNELFLLILLFMIGVIVYGFFIYFIELENDNIVSVPQGFWWAIVTMTTVGYGDIVPMTVQGKLLGSVCAITGILIVALPVPVIAANFNKYYSCVVSIERMRKRRREAAAVLYKTV